MNDKNKQQETEKREKQDKYTNLSEEPIRESSRDIATTTIRDIHRPPQDKPDDDSSDEG